MDAIYEGAVAIGTAIAAGFFTVFGYLMNRNITRMDDDIKTAKDDIKAHAKLHADCGLELANFKTSVAENYEKKETTQQSLSRVHDRIDDIANNFDRKMDTVIGLLRK